MGHCVVILRCRSTARDLRTDSTQECIEGLSCIVCCMADSISSADTPCILSISELLLGALLRVRQKEVGTPLTLVTAPVEAANPWSPSATALRIHSEHQT